MDTFTWCPIGLRQLTAQFLCSALIAVFILCAAYYGLPRLILSLGAYLGRGGEIERQEIQHKNSSHSFYALIIGIDNCPKLDPLAGAAADADRVTSFLVTELGVPSDHIISLRNENASRAAIIQGLHKLRDDPRITNGDPIFVYYAGHGGSKRDPRKGQVAGKMNEVQVIFPYDYGVCKTGSDEPVNCIPDYTIAALLDELATTKGNNITVVFDSCHSASGSRDGFEGLSALRPRCAPVLYGIPPDLDADIIKKGPGLSMSRAVNAVLYTDQASHILLAACGSRERAWEHDKQGQFTSALLTALRTRGVDKVTYHNLLISLPKLANQSPHCYGANKSRILFDSRVSSFKPAYIPVTFEKEALVLGAGISSGIASESIWELYDSTANDSLSLGRFIAGIPHISTTVLSPLTGNHETSVKPILNWDLAGETRLYARQVGAGVGNELKVSFSAQALLFWGNDLEKRPQSKTRSKHEVGYVQHPQGGADVRVETSSESGKLEVGFSLCDPLAEKYNVSKLDQRKPPNRGDVEAVLFAAAKWNWHLRRTNTRHIEDPGQSIVGMEMYKVGERTRGNHREFLRTPEPVLAKYDDHGPTRLVELVARDRNLYGVKLSNKRSISLHVRMFYFDATDFSIVQLFGHSASNDQGDPELPASGELVIGDGGDGGSPLRFTIPPTKKVELGYLKVFWSTERLELDDIVQTSAFNPKSSRGIKSITKGKAMKDWGTVCLALVQRSPLEG